MTTIKLPPLPEPVNYSDVQIPGDDKFNKSHAVWGYTADQLRAHAAAVSAAKDAEIAALRETQHKFGQVQHDLLTQIDQLRADAIRTQNEVVMPLRERIKLLEDALRSVAASHAWQLFGESRAFGTDRIPSPGQCHDIARAALGDKT